MLTKEFNILSIDPSGFYKHKKATIGVAFSKWEFKNKPLANHKNLIWTKLLQYKIEKESDLDNFYKSLKLLIKENNIDDIIIEDYVLYQHSANSQMWQDQPTSQTIGAIKFIAREFKIPITMQRASEAKRFTNKIMSFHLWGFLTKKGNKYYLGEMHVNHSTRHSMDAFRHSIVFIQKKFKKLVKKN